MPRVGLLRTGYAGLGLAILCLAGSFVPALGLLVPLGALVAVVAAILLVLSQDDIPKWSGAAFLAYALLTIGAFIAATPATVRLSFWRGWVNATPHPAAVALQEYLLLALPIMLAATALVAAWEREHGPRLLLAGGLAGLLAVALLTLTLNPAASATTEQALQAAQAQAAAQAGLLHVLLALSTGAAAAGALWAAWRPDEIH